MTSFAKWKSELNKLSIKAVGLTTSDLEDYCWRDSFEDGLAPGEALFYFFSENGYTRRYPDLFAEYMELEKVV